MWFPWAQAFVSAFSVGLGILQIMLGYTLTGRWVYTRSGSPYTFWFLTGSCFAIAAIFVISGVRDYLEERAEDTDAPPNQRWRGP